MREVHVTAARKVANIAYQMGDESCGFRAVERNFRFAHDKERW
jgi:hypothetical protein